MAAVLTGPARAEAVAVVANMTAAALRPGVGGSGERRAQDHRAASGTGGAGLSAAVVDGAGPRARRVHDAAVRAGGGGSPAGLAAQRRGGDRHRSGDLG